MDFFKLRNKEIQEEHGAGDEGTPSLVAKYKAATPGQTSSAPSRQPARKGDKLNAKMDYSKKIKQDDITVKNSMKNEETEVNEISKKTLGSYIKKASHDTVSRSMKYGKKEDESGAHTKDLNKINKREAGIRKATDRLTKEDAVQEGENKQMKGKDPCWKGYQMVGTKKKGGKEVPNCVPANEEASPMIKAPKNEFGKKEDAFTHAKKVGGKVMKRTFTNPRTGIKNVSYVVKEDVGIQEAKMSDADVLSAAKRLAANGKDAKTKSFGKGLVDFYNKNDGFTPDQVAGLQNIMKNASFQMAKEGVMKNIKRQLTARDADSRAGEEASKMMDAQHSGDKAKAAKHDRRFKKLSALTRKESVSEKLDPSQDAGEYVKDFQKSDAPQFKGKTKKERQKMAVAAYLSAKENK